MKNKERMQIRRETVSKQFQSNETMQHVSSAL